CWPGVPTASHPTTRAPRTSGPASHASRPPSSPRRSHRNAALATTTTIDNFASTLVIGRDRRTPVTPPVPVTVAHRTGPPHPQDAWQGPNPRKGTPGAAPDSARHDIVGLAVR